MPLVTVEMLPGRSEETKAKLVKGITDVLVEVSGGTRDHCWVLIRETEATNWGIGGNVVASEGFKEVMAAYKARVAAKG